MSYGLPKRNPTVTCRLIGGDNYGSRMRWQTSSRRFGVRADDQAARRADQRAREARRAGAHVGANAGRAVAPAVARVASWWLRSLAAPPDVRVRA